MMRPHTCAASAAVAVTTTLTVALAQGPVTPAPVATEAAVVLKGRAPASTSPLRVRLPTPVSFDLPNGLHVMLLEDRRAPLLSFTLLLPAAGGYFDPAERPGLAVFTSAMLREGTATRTSEEIARQLEVLSASLEVTTTMAATDATVTGACLAGDAATVLGLLGDLIVHPAFDARELERYKSRLRAGLVDQRAQTTFLANELFARLINGDHPGARVAPTDDALASVTPAELHAFHRARYVPDGAVLALAGDLSTVQAKALVESALGRWPKAGRRPARAIDPPAAGAGAVHLVPRPHSVQTRLMVGGPALRRTAADFHAMQVLNQVIGAGPTGRLFVNLRERKGYTYAAFSVLAAGGYRGSWSASADVRAEVTRPALEELLAEIARLRDEPVPDDELRRQERAMVASFALSLESPRQILSYHVTRWVHGLPPDYWDTYADRIMAVTAADVQRVARTYLAPGVLQVVVVGDPARIRDGLATFGQVETHRADGSGTP